MQRSPLLMVILAGFALALHAGRAQDAALFQAAESGDTGGLARLLASGANPNAAFPHDGSPLIAAAAGGHLDAVRMLLDRGADPNQAVPPDASPLIAAARGGHFEVVALLLDRGAHIDAIVPLDETALIQASAAGNPEVVRLLIARGANVNMGAFSEGSTGEWRTPLSMARRGGHTQVIALLLEAGAAE